MGLEKGQDVYVELEDGEVKGTVRAVLEEIAFVEYDGGMAVIEV